MSFRQFDTAKIEETKKKYAEEAKQRWGDTSAYAEYEKKSRSYSDAQQNMLDGEGARILSEFGRNRSLAPDSAQAQALVKKWQAYITSHYYTCTKEILSCLGQMYVGDERFTQYIDGTVQARQRLWRRRSRFIPAEPDALSRQSSA